MIDATNRPAAVLKLLAVVGAAMVLAACNSAPSDEKVRLDVQDRFALTPEWRYTTHEIAIKEKKALAEDRVEYTIALTLTRNDVPMSAEETIRLKMELLKEQYGVKSENSDLIRFLLSPSGTKLPPHDIKGTFVKHGGDWTLQ